MLDSGVSILFINKRFIEKHRVKTQKLTQPIEVYNIDETPNQAGLITDVAVLNLEVGEHKEKAVFTITDIRPEDIIIEIDWLQNHNPSIDWYKGIIVMDGCPDDCPSKVTSAKSKLAPRGDMKVRLTASHSKSKTKQVKPKTTVKRINPITPLEVDNEPIEKKNNEQTDFDPEHLAKLQAKTAHT